LKRDSSTIRENFRDRAATVKILFDFSVTKEVLSDLKGRFGRDVKEPTMGRKYISPLAGERGGIVSTLTAIPVALLDKVENFAQENGEITRRWFS